jgi:hypothetical protein
MGRGWKQAFDHPIPLPRGRQLVTPEDAVKFITKLPKAWHDAPEWQAAMETLILVAESGGPTMFARIGVMRPLNCHVERVSDQVGKTIIGAAESRRGTNDRCWWRVLVRHLSAFQFALSGRPRFLMFDR